MPNDQLDELLNRLVSGTGEITGAELEQLRFAIFGTPENEEPSALADIAAALEAPENDEQDESAPCELQSAEDYLARVAAEDQPVPASLLRLVGAAPAARTTIQIVNRGSRLAGMRRRFLLPWGSAIAATVLAGIFGYAIHDFVSRSAPAPAVLSNELANAGAPQSANGTVANAGAEPPSTAPAPTMAVNPPIPTTSHAVQASDYPPESVRLQEVGTVKVKYLVLKTGSVGQCQVEDSSGHPSLDDAACVVVKRWLFKPASLSDGTPVDWWLDAAITYNLVDGTAHSMPPQAPPVATAQAGTTQARGSISTKNEALVKAINEMNAAARAQNWTLALEKAKEADAIKDGKPAALNAPIHAMIVTAAINAKDYAAAMAQIDKNIAAKEGDRTKNLEQALSVAIMAKNKEKTDQYAKELGGNLDNATRLFIASSMMNSGQPQEALDYAKPALEGNPSEAALKFEKAIYVKMNNLAGRRAALEQLVSKYPKLEYWHDLLQLARSDKGLNDEQIMDIYRLRLAVGDLKTDADFQEMAQEALVTGYATEAKGVLEKAQAENLLSGERDQRLMQMASDRAAQDGTAIADLQKRVGADTNSAVKLGLLYWSTGKNQDAEDAIRRAIASNRLADPDAAKMALGHVLLSEGKRADAATAFASVARNSKEANIARLWAIYAFLPATLSASQLRSLEPPTPPVATTSHAVTADDYPPVSVRLQEQGKVGIKYLVKEDGTVGDCNVIASSGKARLDDAACTMAKRRWKFKPATQDGKAVAEFLTAEVAFNLNGGAALSPSPQAPAVQSAGNKASLLTVFLEAAFAEQAHRWAECLEKAREADAIKDDKSPKAGIHEMIITCAVNSRDYAAALGQLDQNIATGEGNMELNLTLAQTYATMSKNKEKADQYESRLKQLLAGITPPVATTSHAVTADDYPPDAIHQQEQGNVVVMYLVNEGGSVDACNVIASSGYSRLDNAACMMVTKRWKFKPATQNGKSVAGYLTAEVAFQLK